MKTAKQNGGRVDMPVFVESEVLLISALARGVKKRRGG